MSDDEREALVAEARRHAEALINGTEAGDADLLHDMAYALEAAQETIAAFIIGGAAHPADDVYQTSIAHPAEEAVAEVVEHLLTMNFDDEPEGFVHRVSGALTQNIVARFALPAPVVTEELKVLRAQVAAVKRLCDETDIETHEATQAWLVGNIRAALTPEADR